MISAELFTVIIDALKNGNKTDLINALNFVTNKNIENLHNYLSNPGLLDQLEEAFYEGLSKCLSTEDFGSFEELIDLSINFNIFFDVKNIKNRFDHLKNRLNDCFEGLMSGLTSELGRIINIIRFFNKFNLLEREFTRKEKEIVDNLHIDEKIIGNLRDLFGKVSNSLIYFTSVELPKLNYEFFKERSLPYLEFEYGFNEDNINQIITMILGYLNQYPVYGLSIQNIGKVELFIRKMKSKTKNLNANETLVEFVYRGRKHLFSQENIKKNLEKILDTSHYNFYNLTMVLLGGLGPQGHGFTYSTPRGEVVEICSDRRENEAIIIKYKQFLKEQFLKRLDNEMMKLDIEPNITKKVIEYLSELLGSQELINYYKKEPILKKLYNYLGISEISKEEISSAYKSLIQKISNAMNIILRPIDLIDQFICRMDLVADEKIKSEDIAKLTRLKEKSHYDVLRERFFFQHVIQSFARIYKMTGS